MAYNNGLCSARSPNVMVSIETFQIIRERYGHCASWAVWAPAGKRPKDNIADIAVLDPKANVGLLDTLNTGFVFLGLNISRKVERTFGNFHDPRAMATDFKIRAALSGTRFRGSYMTDIIKDFEQKASGKLMRYLNANPVFEKHNIAALRQELLDLRVKQPTIVPFGKDAKRIAKRNLASEYEIVGIPHYANYMSCEKYRAAVAANLAALR